MNVSNPRNITEQYEACQEVGGFCRREDRGLIELTGADRADWLNHFVTNVITTLRPGEGNYVFAPTLKGRVVFDANVLILEDRIWLDIDRRLIEKATDHLNRYIITEDVRLADISERSHRLAVLGPTAHALVQDLGFGNLVPMAWLQHSTISRDNVSILMMRHDFAGLPGAEFMLTGRVISETAAAITQAAERLNLCPVDRETINILRIEAGIPASVEDIDEDVLPPETGQRERGISHQKGCYLGQEVIERMRSHDVLPRTLVCVRFDGDAPVPPRSRLEIDGQEVGHTRSGCFSEAVRSPVSLAYVKTPCAAPGTTLIARLDEGPRAGTVVNPPLHR